MPCSQPTAARHNSTDPTADSPPPARFTHHTSTSAHLTAQQRRALAQHNSVFFRPERPQPSSEGAGRTASQTQARHTVTGIGSTVPPCTSLYLWQHRAETRLGVPETPAVAADDEAPGLGFADRSRNMVSYNTDRSRKMVSYDMVSYSASCPHAEKTPTGAAPQSILASQPERACRLASGFGCQVGGHIRTRTTTRA